MTKDRNLHSAEGDVASAQAVPAEAQSTEARLGKLMKNGWTPRANCNTAFPAVCRKTSA